MSVERHYFPGNNTPLGFFSYYKHILGQREANKIICIKGGPGTGKSTFMRRIGETFFSMGEDVDFLHCSADEHSLDGVVLQNRKVAIIDGTSPHVTDPVSPGAVDRIINLGEFWNEEGIAANKDEIIDLNEECSRWYRIAYNYLNAAKSVYRSLEEIYNGAAESSEIYRIVGDIVAREYEEYEISLRPGRAKKFFASAITANGTVHYMDSLLSGIPGSERFKRIYLVSAPAGFSNRSFMEILSEGAIYRGLDVETYYCAMCPEEKIEHLIIPALGLAFITVNEYHDMEPWEIGGVDLLALDDRTSLEKEDQPEIILLDTSDYMNHVTLAQCSELIDSLRSEYDILLEKTVKCLEKAKRIHMKVEEMYIPNMNFTQISRLGEAVIEELKGMK